MNNLKIFENKEFGKVRTAIIEGDPWFVGKDVAKALGYERTADAIRAHVDNEDKGLGEIQTPGGKQSMTIINESGLYSLIFSSKLDSAKRFKRWVTSEVLPAIRKTGKYNVKAPKAKSLKEVLEYAKFIKEVFKDQGASPEEISKAIDEGCSQYGVKFPEYFKDESKLTLQDVFDMVDFVFEHPKIGRRKPTYEDFIESKTVVSRRRLT